MDFQHVCAVQQKVYGDLIALSGIYNLLLLSVFDLKCISTTPCGLFSAYVRRWRTFKLLGAHYY